MLSAVMTTKPEDIDVVLKQLGNMRLESVDRDYLKIVLLGIQHEWQEDRSKINRHHELFNDLIKIMEKIR